MTSGKIWAWASVAAASLAWVEGSCYGHSPAFLQPKGAFHGGPSRESRASISGRPLVGRLPLRGESRETGKPCLMKVTSSSRGWGVPQQYMLPNLLDRLTPRQHEGGVDQLREGLNMLHVERERLIKNVMKKIRAASYDWGEQDWNRLFTEFDRDRNGWLDFKEFQNMCRSMGLKPSQLSSDELWIVFEELDYDRTSTVEVSDFTRWLSNVTPAASPFTARQAMAQPAPWTYGGGEGFSLNMPVPEEILSSALAQGAPKEEPASLRGQAAPSTLQGASQAGGGSGGGGASSTLDGLVQDISVFVDTPEPQLRTAVYYFLNELGLSRQKVMGLAIAAPAIFEQNVNTWVRPQVEYLLEIGVPSTRIGKMIVAFPQTLEISLEKKESAVAYLESLGMPLHSVGKCISSQPQLLGLSVESKLAPTVEFLTRECRIPASKVGSLIASFPTVLAYGIETTLKPRLAYIRNELHVPRHRLGALVLKFPQLLGLNVEANLQPTVRYMVNEVGIPQAEISKIVQQHPQILGLSVEANLKPKVSFLLHELGVPPEKLARIISSFPTLLSLSIEANLRPKLAYLVAEGGFSREDVLKAPHLLAYSLKQRIQPRIEFLRNSDEKQMALHSILSLSNQAFERRFLGYTSNMQSS